MIQDHLYLSSNLRWPTVFICTVVLQTLPRKGVKGHAAKQTYLRSKMQKIKSNRYSNEPGVSVLDHDNMADIENLLTGRRVVEVEGDHLLLDNGTVIKAIGNDGGCSCGSGDYDLTILNSVDNIITSVVFDYQPAGDNEYTHPVNNYPDDPTDLYTGYYRIFVYAAHEPINLMQFNGSDGNGYYGTGFSLLVRPV